MEYLTYEEAASYIGVTIDRFYHLVSENVIPVAKHPGLPRRVPKEILDYLFVETDSTKAKQFIEEIKTKLKAKILKSLCA